MQPTYFVKHPDNSYTEADPQPLDLSVISETIHAMFLPSLITERIKAVAIEGGTLTVKE